MTDVSTAVIRPWEPRAESIAEIMGFIAECQEAFIDVVAIILFNMVSMEVAPKSQADATGGGRLVIVQYRRREPPAVMRLAV